MTRTERTATNTTDAANAGSDRAALDYIKARFPAVKARFDRDNGEYQATLKDAPEGYNAPCAVYVSKSHDRAENADNRLELIHAARMLQRAAEAPADAEQAEVEAEVETALDKLSADMKKKDREELDKLRADLAKVVTWAEVAGDYSSAAAEAAAEIAAKIAPEAEAPAAAAPQETELAHELKQLIIDADKLRDTIGSALHDSHSLRTLDKIMAYAHHQSAAHVNRLRQLVGDMQCAQEGKL